MDNELVKMDNELLKNYNGQITTSDISYTEQNGDHNLSVNNSGNGIINLNLISLSNENGKSYAESLIAVSLFSKEYYQLIVTCDEDIFINSVVSVNPSRALNSNGVPPEIKERCSSLSEKGIEELKRMPAIICVENKDYKGVTSSDQFAIYAYIKDIKKNGNNINLYFHTLGVFPQVKLCSKENAPYFDINVDCAITDLNISAWTVHKVNLFDAFEKASIDICKAFIGGN